MELIHVKGNTYYIKNATNIGVYKVDENQVYLIDSGNDKDSGRKICKLMEEHGFFIVGVISTHSNADHVGGNRIIQQRTGAKIFASSLETCFIEHPILESTFLYGGYPFQDLKNKFLCAKESVVDLDVLPDGLEVISLKGHFLDMIGVKTSDNVYFLADSLFSEETIFKYHLFFIYDVREFLNTLNMLEELDGDFYIPSHASMTNNIKPLIEINRKKVYEIMEVIFRFCEEKTFEEILKAVFDYYHLSMNVNQYVLVGSTIKSYLAYLCDEQRIIYKFKDYRMVWEKIDVKKEGF